MSLSADRAPASYSTSANDALRRVSRPACEPLETRRMFVPLVIVGTPLANLIEVDVAPGVILYTIDGAPFIEPDAAWDEIIVDGMPGDDVIIINGNSDNPTTILGGPGADEAIVGDGDLLLNITSPVMFEGGIGIDGLVLDDTMGPPGPYLIDPGAAVKLPGLPVFYSPMVESVTLEASAGPDIIDIPVTGPGTTVNVNGNGGPDAFFVADTAMGTSVAVDGGADLDVVVVDSDDDAFEASVTFEDIQDLAMLEINDGSTVEVADVAAPLVLETVGLDVAPGAALDLNDNDMIVDYDGASPLPAIMALLATGHAGGAWDGLGINTSSGDAATTALGYAEAADVLSAAGGVFSGVPVDGTAVLVKSTFYGDANLDGMVSLPDFNRLAANFGATGALWSEGNFNFDAIVSLADFSLLAPNFGMAGAGPSVGDSDGSSDEEDLL